MAWCHFHRHVFMVISFTIMTDCFRKWDGDRQIYLLVYLTICEAHKDNHSCFREKCFLPCLRWPFWSGFQIFKKVFEFFVTFHLFSLSCSLQNKLIFVQLGFQFFSRSLNTIVCCYRHVFFLFMTSEHIVLENKFFLSFKNDDFEEIEKFHLSLIIRTKRIHLRAMSSFGLERYFFWCQRSWRREDFFKASSSLLKLWWCAAHQQQQQRPRWKTTTFSFSFEKKEINN